MLLPIDLVEVIMSATLAIVGVIMWRTVTAPASPLDGGQHVRMARKGQGLIPDLARRRSAWRPSR